MRRWMMTLIGIMLFLTANVWPAAAAGAAVSIPDKGLEAHVRAALYKPKGQLTVEDLVKLRALYAYEGDKISNLEGLQNATKLTTLILDGNPIQNLGPLKQLNQLTMLGLNNTGLKHLTALSGLTKLEELLVSSNQIEDLAPLSNLVSLTDLLADHNRIKDITPISKLSYIEWVDLSSNLIEDIRPLQSNNSIKVLNLSNNRIKDITPLLSMGFLMEVDLSGNPMNKDAAGVVSTLRSNGVQVVGGPGEIPSDAIKVYIDDEEVAFQQAPVIHNGTTLVPFRAIFEKLGLDVSWDPKTRTVTGRKERFSITLTIDNKTATVNGQPTQLTQAPRIINNSTFVPLRFIGEATGRKVTWIADTRSITIDTTFASIVNETLFSEGLEYSGWKKNGLPHGQGTYHYDGDEWYVGSFVDGRMEGQGKMVDPYDPNSYYEGTFRNNVPHGQGKMVYSDNNYYVGGFVNGERSGRGKLYTADGFMYFDGTYQDNAIMGQGTLLSQAGDRFEGFFQYGRMQGPFKHYRNGVLVYDGRMVDSQYSGAGKLYLEGKLWYEGLFREGYPNGYGIYYDTDTGAKTYEGDIDYYSATGEGTLYYTNGTYYEGEVYRGEANGEGVLYTKDNRVVNSGFFYKDQYHADPMKLKQTKEYKIFELERYSFYEVYDGMDEEETELKPTQALISIIIAEEEHYRTYMSLTDAERLSFMNTYAQDRWGDVLGVQECFVIVEYEGEVLDGTVTSYEQTPDKLKLVKSPQSLEDFIQ